jgi:spermidine/putrescine transport system substrate-binding protein
MARSAIMEYFDADATTAINQMWIDVRCFNVNRVPVWAWIAVAAVVVLFVGLVVWKKRKTY